MWSRVYLKGLSELERHDVVEDGVDGGAQVVQQTTRISHHFVYQDLGGRGLFCGEPVDGVQPLHLKWCPAYEERHHHCHYTQHIRTIILIVRGRLQIC